MKIKPFLLLTLCSLNVAVFSQLDPSLTQFDPSSGVDTIAKTIEITVTDHKRVRTEVHEYFLPNVKKQIIFSSNNTIDSVHCYKHVHHTELEVYQLKDSVELINSPFGGKFTDELLYKKDTSYITYLTEDLVKQYQAQDIPVTKITQHHGFHHFDFYNVMVLAEVTDRNGIIDSVAYSISYNREEVRSMNQIRLSDKQNKYRIKSSLSSRAIKPAEEGYEYQVTVEYGKGYRKEKEIVRDYILDRNKRLTKVINKTVSFNTNGEKYKGNCFLSTYQYKESYLKKATNINWCNSLYTLVVQPKLNWTKAVLKNHNEEVLISRKFY